MPINTIQNIELMMLVTKTAPTFSVKNIHSYQTIQEKADALVNGHQPN